MKNNFAVLFILVWLSGPALGNDTYAQSQTAPPSGSHDVSMQMKHQVSGESPPISRKPRTPLPQASVGVSAKQGKTITLTLTEVSTQRVEKWIRTAGSADPKTKRVRGRVYGKDAGLIKIGQVTRVFPLVGREPVLQGKVVKVSLEKGGALLETDVEDKWYGKVKFYIIEIIVNFGRSLTIPNEAIIEEAGRKIVYVAGKNNRYSPREIIIGHRGELFTQVIYKLKEGEQVVTFGSFFIDAEYKLSAKGKHSKEPGSKDHKGGHFAPHHH